MTVTPSRWGDGVPGVVGYGWVGGEGLYRYPDPASQIPYLVIFSLRGPTHGQMKAILIHFMRFLRYGLILDPELTQN